MFKCFSKVNLLSIVTPRHSTEFLGFIYRVNHTLIENFPICIGNWLKFSSDNFYFWKHENILYPLSKGRKLSRCQFTGRILCFAVCFESKLWISRQNCKSKQVWIEKLSLFAFLVFRLQKVKYFTEGVFKTLWNIDDGDFVF